MLLYRGVGTYTDTRTGPDKVLGTLYHKRSQGQSNSYQHIVLVRTKLKNVPTPLHAI